MLFPRCAWEGLDSFFSHPLLETAREELERSTTYIGLTKEGWLLHRAHK